MKRFVTFIVLLSLIALATPVWSLADGDVDEAEAEVEVVADAEAEEEVEQEIALEVEPEEETGAAYAVKAAWGLRLREEAGLGGDTLMVLRCGEQVSVIGDLEETITKNGYRWVEVSVSRDEVTTTGFVAFKYLTTDLTPNCYLVSWVTEDGPSNDASAY